jgi:hypothetical protein
MRVDVTKCRHVHHILNRFLNVTDLLFFFVRKTNCLNFSSPLPRPRRVEAYVISYVTGAAFFITKTRNFLNMISFIVVVKE